MARTAGFAWSANFPEHLAVIALHEGFITVQHAMNVIHPAPQICEAAPPDEPIPLGMGVLAGKYTPKMVLPKEGIRANSPDWQNYFENGCITAQCATDLDVLRELVIVDGRTLAHAALCWLLAK